VLLICFYILLTFSIVFQKLTTFTQICSLFPTFFNKQEIYQTVKAEINNSRNADHGMFFLFIGSHGVENHVYGSNGELLKLTDLYDLLSVPQNPVVADKPKLVVIQACSTGEFSLNCTLL